MSLDPLTAGLDLVNSVIAKAFPDANDALRIRGAVAASTEDNDVKLLLAQIGTNTEEAKSTNIFITGWRPFVAWVCCVAVMYQTIFFPIVSTYFVMIKGIDAQTFSLTFGLLTTLIGARSFEKFNGIDTK